MRSLSVQLRRIGLALSVTILASLRLSAAETEAKPDTAQLQRNLHDMRAVMEREKAQQDGAARMNTIPLRVDSVDAPGIGMMREQLTQSLSHLENRCFGIDMNVKDGNAILICGNNNGTAENSTVKNTTQTTLVVPQPVKSLLPPPPAPRVEEGK